MPASRQNNHRASRPRIAVPDGKARRTPNPGPRQPKAPLAASPVESELSLRTALEYLREGDVFVVHSIDRLTQNVEDLRKVLLSLTGRGILVEFINALLSTTTQNTETSRLLVKAIGAVADCHRALMKEDRSEVNPAASNAVRRKGRKRSLTPDRVLELRRRAAAGEKKASLAREFGISRETLYQYLSAL
jgi:DNA invertase Pin-like site-specific DNA recombinase